VHGPDPVPSRSYNDDTQVFTRRPVGATTVWPMLIREKVEADAADCPVLLMRVHEIDGYPHHLAPEKVEAFFTSGTSLCIFPR
jgi:hypothetical protein